MSKQDRQGVRTPADIERKYDLGSVAESKGLTVKQEIRINQLYQTFQQYMTSTNAEIDKIKSENVNFEEITAQIQDLKNRLDGFDGTGGGETHIIKPLADKKILCLGDSLMGNDQVNGVPSYLAEYSGATVYNGGFARSGFAKRQTGSANVCFDLPNLIDAMVSGNWSVHEIQAESTSNSSEAYKYFPNTVAMLKDINFSEIDVITLAYGSVDWSNGETAEYVITAVKESIDKIQLNFPEMRILVITPIWRYFTMGSSSGDDCTKYGEGFTLREWAKKIEEAAKEKHISVFNAYENMPLSYNNASTYFDKNSSSTDGLDHTHLNEKGNQLYAQLICGKLCSMLAPSCASISGGLHEECISAEELANLSTLLN